MELFADRLCSGEAAIVCFSPLTAKAMSEQVRRKSSSKMLLVSKTKMEADRRCMQLAREAADKIADEKARTEEAK